MKDYLYPLWPLFVLAFLVYGFEMGFVVINRIKEKAGQLLEIRWIGSIIALAFMLVLFALMGHFNGPYVDNLWGF